jgi:tRNA A37 threonylcarbamoyladenosine dehydratase
MIRTIQLIGEEAFERLQQARVILFGVGGVGGWCAEALLRTGVGHLTIVDFDTIDPSNLNRQVVSTAQNIGLSKVEEMRKRLLSIVPEADVTAIEQRYSDETAPLFDLSQYDLVIDAIDDLDAKMRLICEATRTEAVLFSSMGAGRKLDPQQIRVTEFWKVEGCPLARALRTKMRKSGMLPAKKFQCVYSPEISGTQGTLAPVVGTFGFQLAALAIGALITPKTAV